MATTMPSEPGDDAGVEPDRDQQAAADVEADDPEQDDHGRPPPEPGQRREQHGDDEPGRPS